MATCGETSGHVNKLGQPCGQDLAPGMAACIWHSTDAKGRLRRSRKGWLAQRHRHRPALDPATTPLPALDNVEGTRALLVETIQAIRTDQLDERKGLAVISGIRANIELAQLEVGAQLLAMERRLGLRP